MTVETDRAQPVLILHGKIPETVQIRTTKSNLKAETIIKRNMEIAQTPSMITSYLMISADFEMWVSPDHTISRL